MKLQNDDALETSAVVANCRMNRERELTGSNGYARELGLNPLDFLLGRVADRDRIGWLDLCCGTGRALIQAGRQIRAEKLEPRLQILGVDLAGLFHPIDADLSCVRLIEASLSRWSPGRPFDLISCVHGLHYVGDKLGLIARAAGWLTQDGLFVANLDLKNLKFAAGVPAGRRVAAWLRSEGLEYDRRHRRLMCRGRKVLSVPFRYLGSNDGAGPNYTGQPAVDSYYHDSVRA
jgi:SAM-dependent methyltransferase